MPIQQVPTTLDWTDNDEPMTALRALASELLPLAGTVAAAVVVVIAALSGVWR